MTFAALNRDKASVDRLHIILKKHTHTQTCTGRYSITNEMYETLCSFPKQEPFLALLTEPPKGFDP